MILHLFFQNMYLCFQAEYTFIGPTSYKQVSCKSGYRSCLCPLLPFMFEANMRETSFTFFSTMLASFITASCQTDEMRNRSQQRHPYYLRRIDQTLQKWTLKNLLGDPFKRQGTLYSLRLFARPSIRVTIQSQNLRDDHAQMTLGSKKDRGVFVQRGRQRGRLQQTICLAQTSASSWHGALTETIPLSILLLVGSSKAFPHRWVARS